MRRVHRGFVHFGALAALFACALSAPPAAAMDMKLEGDTLYLSKGIGVDDYVKYKEIVRDKEVRTVVFGDSPGGSIAGAMGIAEDLIQRNVTTVLAGSCRSACTYIFLAGKERLFSSKVPLPLSVIGFHSTYETTGGGQNSRSWALVYSYYKQRLGDAYDASVISRAMSDLSARGGFAYLYHPRYRADGSFCDGSIEKPCETLAGKNAVTLRLVTTEALSDVAIPAELLPKAEFFGLNMESFASITSEDGRQLVCAELSAECEGRLRQFGTFKEYRAMAISPSTKKTGSGVGYSGQRGAVRRALYECVTRSQSSCLLGMVGDRVTLSLYKTALERSASAVGQLADRKAAGGLDDPVEGREYPMSKLRVGSYRAMTPEKIEGVREVKTADVVEILAGKGKAALVDLGCGDTTLPTARCIFGAGLASGDATVESEIGKNLSTILSDLSPDKSTPIVFFCADSLCWLSANASYRAEKAGYKVYWYRGGLKAWEAKGLPVVPNAPIGAVLPNAG